MKQIGFEAKIIIQCRIELIKLPYLFTMIKNTYLKIDIVDYHIFINLLPNQIKSIFYRI